MGKLTIQEIATVLVEKNGIEKRDANRFVSAMFEVIQERLASDQLVKIKGLGTFKIVDVEARESVSVNTGERFTISGHSKVTFTPDATMKELVNKPFSQFETVVLNDGVEFDDVVEEKPVEEQPIDEQPIEEQPVEELCGVAEPVAVMAVPETKETIEPEPIVMPEPEPEAETEPEPEAETEPESESEPEAEPEAVPESEPEAEAEPEAVAEPESETKEETPVVDFDVEEEEERPWNRWLLSALGVLLLMGISAYGGYYYGSQKQANVVAVPDTVFVRDTVVVAPVDSVSLSAEKAEVTGNSEATEKPAEFVEKPAEIVEQPKEQPKTVEPAVDKYAEKDARVRLGAYRIVGLDQEVKVQAGQTFRSICKAYLGPDMECYVEVFNNLPQNPTVKAGQVIKIPKLQIKKKRQQTTKQ